VSATLATYLGRLPGRRSSGELADSTFDGASPDYTPVQARTFWSELRTSGLVRQAGVLVGAHTLETGAWLVGWTCIGSGALSGRIDYGWMAAWALALASTVPLRAMSTWLQGVIALDLGTLIRRHLLSGAVALGAEPAQARGAGESLGDVLESEAIDDLGASGGVATVLALIELGVTPLIFAYGAAAAAQIALLVGWTVLCLGMTAHNARLRYRWTRLRIDLTNRLIENMAAHRTRLVQQVPSQWHMSDDTDVEHYQRASRRLDASTARVEGALPRAYVIFAFAVLAVPFARGATSLTQIALSLGGILFASASLTRLSLGFWQAASAWIAWRVVKPTLDPAGTTARSQVAPPVAKVSQPATSVYSAATLLQVHELTFFHRGRPEPVLRGCSLTIKQGDQILLEGNSGSGKSTLASILAGSRAPTSGFVLSRGLDLGTVGSGSWQKQIALAPQYHENHMLAAPLAFNLLLARAYPYRAADVEEALAVCRELGLGELLERMPAGINQFVGDTGWRLSQGERSRIFLARALLQRADVVVLDESLAALDPENLRQCLECVMRRAPTLILIAHP
jgi:ATP-binding cassette, subfamily B, bacterial